jgi:type III pantothenate kinase
MLLVVDVGNTNTVFGLFQGDKLLGSWRIGTVHSRTADEHNLLLRGFLAASSISPEGIDAVAVACVVPQLAEPIAGMSEKLAGRRALFVGGDCDLGVAVDYRPPSDVGADRIANAVAAHALYGGPAIVVDFGTATTFDAIGADGSYLGGAIAPGVQVASDALASAASRLHRVAFARPPGAIGKSTRESMQSGMYYGLLGQVERIVASMRLELGGRARVIATGGLAKLVAPDCPCIELVHETLTLEGLRMLWERRPAGSERSTG